MDEDEYILDGFVMPKKFSFVGGKSVDIKLNSRNSFVGAVRHKLYKLRGLNNSNFFLTFSEIGPSKATYKCGIFNSKTCYKQGYPKKLEVSSNFNSPARLVNPTPLTQQRFTTYSVSAGFSTDGNSNSSYSISVTQGELEILGKHDTIANKFSATYNYVGNPRTDYKNSLSRQLGSFGVTQSTSNTTFQVTFGYEMGVVSNDINQNFEIPGAINISVRL